MTDSETDVLFYTPQELAKRWRISDRAIHYMAQDGRLEGVTIANRLRIPKHVVLEMEMGVSSWNQVSSKEEKSGTSNTRGRKVSRQPSVLAAQKRLRQKSGQRSS